MNRRSFLTSVVVLTAGCVGGYEGSCEQLGGTSEVNVGDPVDEVTDTGGQWSAPYGPFDGTRSIRESGLYTGTIRRAWRQGVEAVGGGDDSRILEAYGMTLTNGTLYAVVEVEYPDKQLIAIDPSDGAVLWRDDTVSLTGSIVAGPDLLYLRGDGTLVAFDPQERETVWRVQFGVERSVSIPVVDRGWVFVQVTSGDGGGHLYAIRDGQREWNTPASTGPVLSDGRLYTVDESTLKSIDPEAGEVLWTRSLEDEWLDKLAARGGQVYLTGSGVTAVDASSGDRLWSHGAPPGRTRRATVGSDRVYVPTRELGGTWPRLYTYEPDGTEPVSCGQLSPFTLSGPVVVTEELAIYPGVIEPDRGSDTGFLQAQRPDGTVEWRVTWSPGSFSSISLCAGRGGLFFCSGASIEAFVFE